MREGGEGKRMHGKNRKNGFFLVWCRIEPKRRRGHKPFSFFLLLSSTFRNEEHVHSIHPINPTIQSNSTPIPPPPPCIYEHHEPRTTRNRNAHKPERWNGARTSFFSIFSRGGGGMGWRNPRYEEREMRL